MIITLTFHSAFRVGTGNADGTAHATIDRDTPVPASSLKGLMRASAERLLPYRPEVVDAVFGTPRRPCPWHWSPARFAPPPGPWDPTHPQDQRRPRGAGPEPEAETDADLTPPVALRARVKIDPATGTALGDHLVFAEEMSAATARFTVTRTGPLPLDRDGRPLSGLAEQDHLAVLACAAAGLHELGAGRRRGLGWVSCQTDQPALDGTLLARFDQLAAVPADEADEPVPPVHPAGGSAATGPAPAPTETGDAR
ncbi:RAMP superfamily CRISPR-associated protein [Streptomyces fodineus]|nr:RAMP superfamily CRISPR-associated protein [Streptomyces fodineus]